MKSAALTLATVAHGGLLALATPAAPIGAAALLICTPAAVALAWLAEA